MKIERRHIVLASLVLALGAAVYLNWQFSDASSPDNLSVSKELGKASYVSSANVSTSDEKKTEKETKSKQDEYFAQAKSKRQETQDKVLDIAKEVLTLSNSSDSAKENAVQQSAKISGYYAHQSNVENILLAKGFSQCLCFISDDGCSVIVKQSEMKDDSGLIIKDVVASQTGLSFDKISIVTI